MKRTLSLVALATVASVAGPLKVGADALLGLNIPSVGSNVKNTDGKLGFGVAVGPTVGYAVTDKLTLGGGVTFQLNTYGSETSFSFLGQEFKSEASASLMSLGFQVAPSFQATEQLSLKVGYEWSMPLTGSVEFKDEEETVEKDLVWAPSKAKDIGNKESAVVSTHALVVGGSFAVIPNVAVSLQGKFALNGGSPDYDEKGELKGARKSKDNIAVHQVAVGVSYDLGL